MITPQELIKLTADIMQRAGIKIKPMVSAVNIVVDPSLDSVGVYRPSLQQIAVRAGDDLPTLVHECCHHLQASKRQGSFKQYQTASGYCAERIEIEAFFCEMVIEKGLKDVRQGDCDRFRLGSKPSRSLRLRLNRLGRN